MNKETDSLSPAQRLVSDMQIQVMDIHTIASRLNLAIANITGYSFSDGETSSPKKEENPCMHQELQNILSANSYSFDRLLRCVCELEQYVGINPEIQND